MNKTCKPKQRNLCGRPDCKTCFPRSLASHPMAKFYSKNNKQPAIHVFKGSNDKTILWTCPECPSHHEFDAQPCNVMTVFKRKRQLCAEIEIKSPCPYHAGKLRCEKWNCGACFRASFASHPRAANWLYDEVEWIDDEGNQIIASNQHKTPRDFAKSSHDECWFRCECGHIFKLALNIITAGQWCGYCAISTDRLCHPLNNCTVCDEKSFAPHPRAANWLYEDITFVTDEGNEITASNGGKTPRDFRKSSNKEFWFKCECGHIIRLALTTITVTGSWCGYCCEMSDRLCHPLNNCTVCYEKSFAPHPRAANWLHEDIDIVNKDGKQMTASNGGKTPRNFRKNSHEKCWFRCDECNKVFDKRLNDVTSQNGWCPICKNKTEKKFMKIMSRKFPSLIHQFKPEWCKNPETGKHLPFDFALVLWKIIIELDGRQHFVQVSNWDAPEDVQYRDRYKEECARKEGFRVIRLLQQDVWKDTGDWESKVCEKIEYLIANDVKYDVEDDQDSVDESDSNSDANDVDESDHDDESIQDSVPIHTNVGNKRKIDSQDLKMRKHIYNPIPGECARSRVYCVYQVSK